MDPELKAMIARMIAAKESDEDIEFVISNWKPSAQSKPSAWQEGLTGIKEGFKNSMEVGKHALGTPLAMIPTLLSKNKPQPEPVPEPTTTGGKVARFAGEVVGELPVGAMTGSLLGSIGRKSMLKALGPAGSKTAAFAKGAAAGIPGNVAAGVVTEGILHPEEIQTAEGIAKVAAFSGLGTIIDGLFNVRAYKGLSNANAIAKSKLQDPNFLDKTDSFLEHIESVLRGDPLNGPKVKNTITPLDVSLESRPWNRVEPKGAKEKAAARRVVQPNDVDVQGYAEEIAADMTQREAYASQLTKIINKIKAGTHTERDLLLFDGIQTKFDNLSIRISNMRTQLDKAAVDQRGLVLGGVPDSPLPQTVFKVKGNTKPNITDPKSVSILKPLKSEDLPGSTITRPGSGNGSPYAYVPVEDPPADPLMQVLAPKVEGGGNKFSGYSPAENEMLSKIDLGNAAATAARVEERTLLSGAWNKLRTNVQDFLHPLKLVSEDAYDQASKFLRINARSVAGIEDAVYIPDGKGGYTRGAESLVPIIRALDSDPTNMARFQIYAHAMQTLAVDKTPFSKSTSQTILNEYEKLYPEIVATYKQYHEPLAADLLKVIEGYQVFTPEVIETLKKNPHWVPLVRSKFGDPASKASLLNKRTNPGSESLVGDYFHNMYANIRGLIRTGERTEILRSLLRARQGDESLKGIVDIIEPVKAEALEDYVKGLPEDMPDMLKRAFAETFAMSNNNGRYSFMFEGKRVSVQLNDDLAKSLDLMQFRGNKNADKSGNRWVRQLNIGDKIAGAEKAATGMYSVYRDMFAGGLLLDAVEIAINSGARGYKFNLVKDPIRGFFALYGNDPMLRDLAGHGGALGFRYADPRAEYTVSGVEELVKVAKNSGLMLRVKNPKAAFFEFAGNLSNASRAGLVLANKDRPTKELAGLYNNILGDPAKVGMQLAAYSRYTGFMNYPIQANVAQIESLLKGTLDAGKVGQVSGSLALMAARAGGWVTAPAMVAWYLTKDDPRVSKLRNSPEGRKFIYMPDPFNTDEIVAMKKPQGIWGQIFATLPEQMMEELRSGGQNDVIEQVMKGIAQELTPNMMPLIANSAIALTTGRSINQQDLSTYSIVPGSRAGMLPEDEAGTNVTNTAQTLAEYTGMSAAKWDRAMRTFLIGTSFNVFQQADRGLFGNKSKAPVHNRMHPFSTLGFSNVDPSAPDDKIVAEFYEQVGGLAPILKSFDGAISNGQRDRANIIFAEHGKDFNNALLVTTLLEQMQVLNKAMQVISYNEMKTPEEKKASLEKYKEQRGKLAQRGLDMLNKK